MCRFHVPVCVLNSFRCVWLFVTPWTAAHQVPLPMGILQARILEWGAIPFSRGSFWHKDWTRVSCISYIGRWILYHCTTWEAQLVSQGRGNWWQGNKKTGKVFPKHLSGSLDFCLGMCTSKGSLLFMKMGFMSEMWSVDKLLVANPGDLSRAYGTLAFSSCS